MIDQTTACPVGDSQAVLLANSPAGFCARVVMGQ